MIPRIKQVKPLEGYFVCSGMILLIFPVMQYMRIAKNRRGYVRLA